LCIPVKCVYFRRNCPNQFSANMNRSLQTYSPAKNIEALLFAGAGFLLIFLSLKGVGISADSITYTSVSRNLNATGTLRTFDEDALVDFPMGYPLFLAAIQFLTRLDPFVYGLFLNAVLFGIIIYIIQCLLREDGLPTGERLLCGACLVLSPALLQVFEMLWSETLFMFYMALFLAGAVHYGKTHRKKYLWLMAMATALACVTRYAGVTLAATGGLILLFDRALPFRKRFWNAFLFGSVSISLLTANLIRNSIISGHLTGDRKKNFLSATAHLHRFGGVLFGWLPPIHQYPLLYTACALLSIAGMMAACAYFWIKRKESLSIFAISLAYCVVYSLFILTTALLTEYEGLDTRLLSPLYIPGLIGLLGFVHTLLGQSFRYVTKGMILGGLSFLLIGDILLDYNYLAHPDVAYKGYIRYNVDSLKVSPTLQFLKDYPSRLDTSVSVYSNAPDIMYLVGSREADYLPDLRSAEDLLDFRTDHGAYLIWLNACMAYPDSYLPALEQLAPLTLVHSFQDGAIYIHP